MLKLSPTQEQNYNSYFYENFNSFMRIYKTIFNKCKPTLLAGKVEILVWMKTKSGNFRFNFK